MDPPPVVAPIVSEELAAFVQSGLSIAIGSRDARLAPEGARVWALVIAPDRVHLEAYLYAPAAHATLANLEANGRVALVVDRPTDHRACQLKGDFLGWRPARADERAVVARQFDALCEELERIQIPRVAYAPACRWWPAVAVRVRLTDVFRQDPGPGAGERLLP